MLARGRLPQRLFAIAEGRARFKHFYCDDAIPKVVNRDIRLDLGTSVGEYRLVKKHKVVLRAEITEQKK
jgi:hypothetical protein